MSKQEKRIAVPGGELAVVDHGGTGHDVLLVHSVCHASPVWDAVAGLLTQHARVVVVDMRGHGQSTADTTRVEQIPEDLALVIDELSLDRPVVVGYDVSGGFATAVAASHPDEVGGLVIIDSPVVGTQEEVRDIVRTVGSEAIVTMLTERFGLGKTGADTASMEAFLDHYSALNTQDWLSVAPDAAGTRALLQRMMLVAEDGSWIYRPTPESVRAMTADPDGSTYQPGVELIAEVEAPVTVVTLSRGRNGAGGDELVELAASRDDVRIARLDGDTYVLYNAPEILVREIRDVIAAVEKAS